MSVIDKYFNLINVLNKVHESINSHDKLMFTKLKNEVFIFVVIVAIFTHYIIVKHIERRDRLLINQMKRMLIMQNKLKLKKQNISSGKKEAVSKQKHELPKKRMYKSSQLIGKSVNSAIKV